MPTTDSTDHRQLEAAFARLAAGDQSGLRDVWEARHRALYAYALSVVRDPDEAEDVLCTAVARLPGQGRRLRQVSDPEAYLFAMVRNEAVSWLRRIGRRRWRLIEDGDATCPDVTGALMVRQAVLSLPADQREAVALHVWGGLTFEQVGRVTGFSPNTASGRYRYALEKLKKALGDDGNEPEETRRRAEVGPAPRAGA